MAKGSCGLITTPYGQPTGRLEEGTRAWPRPLPVPVGGGGGAPQSVWTRPRFLLSFLFLASAENQRGSVS